MTRRLLRLLAGTCAVAALAAAAPPLTAKPAAGRPPLVMGGSTDIPAYKGDFDHFALDEKGDRLFLAGEEGKRLLVFKLSTGALIKTVTTVDTPHSLLWMPDRNELLVVDGGAQGSEVLDGATYALKRRYRLPAPGADSTAYDAGRGRLYVVTGGKDVPMKVSYLVQMDPRTGHVFSSTKFDADHVEALAVEAHGSHLFINVTDKNVLDVLDKSTGKIEKSWPVKEAEQNAPLDLDEVTHRLFVVTRKPGKLLVLNAATGATVASFKAPERTDQVVWDAHDKRVYVTGGEGYVGTFQQDDADHYRELARTPSAPGAKTAIVARTVHRLYVAASPGDTGAQAKLLWFDIKP